MNFRDYTEKECGIREFCHSLAVSARHKIWTILEMAMGGQNISKMKVLPQFTTWKFLQQFPPEFWKNAYHWQQGPGIIEMMKQVRERGEIPEEQNWIDEFQIPIPRASNKVAIFGEPGKPVYIGLTDLVKELTSPPKSLTTTSPEDLPDVARKYWAGEGPSLEEINPHEQDKNHPAHPSKYKHGKYDFDIEDLAEVTPEHIDEMPDSEVIAMLPEKYQNMDESDPELKAKIAKKKEAMKKVLKSSFAGYDPQAPDTARRTISNLIRGQAIGLFGEHPKAVEDPISGKDVYPVEKIHSNLMRKDWKFTYGKNEVPLEIPAIKKHFTYKIKDLKTGKISDPKEVDSYVPVFNPAKGVSNKIALSANQKEELAKRGLKSFDDLEGLINNWDILTDEQKNDLLQNTKSLDQVAKAYHVYMNNPEAEVEHEARPHNIYGVAGQPNQKAAERPYLKIKPEKADAFIDKYKGVISGEVAPILTKLLRSYAKSGKHSEVIKALEKVEGQIAEVVTYHILTWLSSPRFGIHDDEFNLLPNLPDVDVEKNKENRELLVWKEVAKIVQIGFTDVPPRRIREKQGLISMGGEEATESGKAGTQKKIQHDPVRAQLLSKQGSESIVRGAQKPHEMFNKLKVWLATYRNRILKSIPSDEAAEQLKKDNDNIIQALEISEELYQKFQAELSSKFEDPTELDDEVQRLVSTHLPSEISRRMSGLTSSDQEELLAKIKDVTHAGLSRAVGAASDEETKAVIDKFIDNLAKYGQANLPTYDSNAKQFHDTRNRINLEKFHPNRPIEVIQFLAELVPSEKMKADILRDKGPALYAAVQNSNGFINVVKSRQQYATALQQYSGSQSHVQMPQGQPQTQPQTQPQLAARILDNSLNTALNFNTPQEMMDIARNLMSKKNEFKANPAAAAKLGSIINQMKAKYKSMNGPPTQAFNLLATLMPPAGPPQ